MLQKHLKDSGIGPKKLRTPEAIEHALNHTMQLLLQMVANLRKKGDSVMSIRTVLPQ
jgi:hypothetical protein